LQQIVQHEETRVPANGAVRVLTVDDDATYRCLVRDVIDAMAGFDLVGEACTGEEGVSMAETLHPELVLMDVRMPGIGGVEAARRIGAGAHDPIAVVLMSADPSVLTPASVSGRTIGLLRKERLGPRSLRAIWDAWTAGRRS
jgi:two-component system, NarL family, invasion response regulator UvrY